MSLVEVTHVGRVAVITLDDPARRNTLSLELCTELSAAVAELEADPDTGALVVTGRAPAFCAGADLSQLGESRREGLLAIYSGFLAVARTPLPTVAAVNGAAVGAGMNLALACDVRVVGDSGRFDTRFLDLGIHPGGGHTWMLRRIVGPQTASALVLFGQVLGAAEAVRGRSAWEQVGDDDLLDRSVELAGTCRRRATGARPTGEGHPGRRRGDRRARRRRRTRARRSAVVDGPAGVRRQAGRARRRSGSPDPLGEQLVAPLGPLLGGDRVADVVLPRRR